ncbi:MAG: hypothetical protein QW154_07365 [Sulfolobales archaeon]
MIMCYYWIVTGWIFYYMLHAIAGTFFTPGFDASAFWSEFGFTPASLGVGAFMLTLLINILILLGVNPYLQWVVKGVVLVTAAVALTRGVRYAK